MKKIFPILVSSSLILSSLSSTAIAADNSVDNTVSTQQISNNSYTESQLNQILSDAGASQSLLTEIDYEQKLAIVADAGENLSISSGGSTAYTRNDVTGELEPIKPPSPDEFTTLAISRADLYVNAQHVSSVKNGKTIHKIIGYFRWEESGRGPKPGPGGVVKDSIGLAVADGYQIIQDGYSASYSSNTFGINGKYNGWTPYKTTGLGDNGQPDTSELYGASWQFRNVTPLASGITLFKGSVSMSMIKKGGASTVNRAIVKYNEANSNALGNFSVSVAFGPASVTFTPSAGSADNASDDEDW
ncbi:hypothetical protein [Paenibacillus kyungheensis]